MTNASSSTRYITSKAVRSSERTEVTCRAISMKGTAAGGLLVASNRGLVTAP